EQNSAPYLSVSLSFLGIIRSEQGNFADSEESFTRANTYLNEITDTKARDYTEFAVTGYYARSLFLQGKVDRSMELYKQALSLGQKTNVQQKLALSQLHQGLGECFMALGEHKLAETELQAAIHLDRKA